MIEPICPEQQQAVRSATEAYIQRAESLFEISLARIEISFNLKGKCAGMYRVRNKRGTKLFRKSEQVVREIRYNPYLFAKYFDDNIRNTVPHEVAHFVADQIYGARNIRPHGPEWKNIMLAFEVAPNRTCDYDMTDIPTRVMQTYDYACDCMTHQLTIRRHNQITGKRKIYSCRRCKSVLQPAKTMD